MIELIFVIVIIGILAAVAIPKLAATRDDAKISNLIANARTAMGDMTAYYTSQGNAVWIDANTTISMVSSVPFMETDCSALNTADAVAGNPFALCDETDGNACITITPNAAGTQIAVASVTTGTICGAVAEDPAVKALVEGSPHRLGGLGVNR
jgi:general secretion pathway protein G